MDELQCTKAMSTSNESSCLGSMTDVYSKIEEGYCIVDLELVNRQDIDPMSSAMPEPESSDKFKVAFLVLVPVLGLISITTLQVSLQELIGSSVFDKYAQTFILGVFSLKIISHKFIVMTMQNSSVVFNELSESSKSKAAQHFGSFFWGIFYVPITSQLVFKSFQLSPDDFFKFYGSYVKVCIQQGLLDQLLDLVLRRCDYFLHAHHYGEVIYGIFFLNFTSTDQRDPGGFILTLLFAYDRLIHHLYGLTNLSRNFEKLTALKKDFTLGRLDKFIPSAATLAGFYFISFWFYVVFLRLVVTGVMILYFSLNFYRIPIVWKILLPAGNILFILIDWKIYQLLWNRAHAVDRTNEQFK